MKSGETIQNHLSGEILTMIVGEQESAGRVQLYRVHLPPHRPSPPLHYHLAFTETFTGVEGTLDMFLGPERRHVRLGPGESVTADRRQLHSFANNSNLPCIMTVETRPPGGVVHAFQLAYGLANDGGAAPDGLPANPILRLRFLDLTQGFLPGVPLLLQRAILGLARILATVTGLERRVRRYLNS